MKFYARAFRYVVRKKSKSVLLFCIIAVSASMIVCGSSVLQEVKAQQQTIGEKTHVKLSVTADEHTGPLTTTQAKQLSTLDNVARINTVSNAVAAPVDFELAPGTETPQQEDASLHGYDDTATDSPFAAQLLRLQSGSHLGQESAHAALIHHALAEANALSIGDTIVLQGRDGKQATATIQGLYQTLSDDNAGGQQKITAQRAENQIYVTPDVMQALQSRLVYDQVFVYLKNPEELPTTQQALESLLPEHTISVHDALYKRMQGTLGQVEKSTVLLLVLTASTAVIAITLLLCMWTRERMQEFAVLLSLGRSFWDIFMQMYTELVLILSGAVVVSLPIASLCLPLLGRWLFSEESGIALEIQVSLTSSSLFIVCALLILVAAVLLALIPLARTPIKTLLSSSD